MRTRADCFPTGVVPLRAASVAELSEGDEEFTPEQQVGKEIKVTVSPVAPSILPWLLRPPPHKGAQFTLHLLAVFVPNLGDISYTLLSLQPDGGVVKKVLVAGEGWQKPEKGDKVTGEVPPPPPALFFDAPSVKCTKRLGPGLVRRPAQPGATALARASRSAAPCFHSSSADCPAEP